jgi:putative Holliday junction resolvase
VTEPAQGAARRILALDLGARRIGLALSDERGVTARGLRTLHRSSKRQALAAVARLAAEQGVGLILVGHPLRLSGEEGPEALRARRFAEELAERTGLPVKLLDERFTTVQARRVLRECGVRLRKQAQPVVDRVAAVLLLEAYLDARAAGREG